MCIFPIFGPLEIKISKEKELLGYDPLRIINIFDFEIKKWNFAQKYAFKKIVSKNAKYFIT